MICSRDSNLPSSDRGVILILFRLRIEGKGERFGVGVGGMSVSWSTFEGGVEGGELAEMAPPEYDLVSSVSVSAVENAEVNSLKSWSPVFKRVLL